MAVPEYPEMIGGNRFLMTDNKGGSYNKIYFVLCNGAEVKRGDELNAVTRYRIWREI